MPSSRRTQWAKLRIAATAFTALLILGVFLVLLTGGTVLQPKDTIHAYVPDAAGISVGTPVRLNGIPIGKITGVRFTGSRDPNRVVDVEMQVEHRYLNQLARDSVASITSEDIQGDKFLDITRGRNPQTIRPGGEVPFQATPEVLKALDLAQFTQRLRVIDALLADIQAGKGQVGQLVRGDAIYRDLVIKVKEAEKALYAATSTQRVLGQLLYRDTLYQDIMAPVRRLDEGLARIQRGEGDMGRLVKDPRQYDELQDRIGAMRRELAGWNAGQGGAGRFLKDDAMYAKWNRQVARLLAAVESFNAGEGAAGHLLMSAQPYESINGAMRELAETLRDFREHPSRYMRIKLF